jgi:acetyl-CoA acetyltransferase
MSQPVIIGVGQLRNRSAEEHDAREPASLIAEAVELAFEDTGASSAIRGKVNALDVVNVVSWPYADLPGLLCEGLGIVPAQRLHSGVGGHQPARLVDLASRRIVAGESRVALVCGGESYYSLSTFRKEGRLPPWTRPPADVKMPSARTGVSDLAWKHGLSMPIRVYPLYENGLRAALGQTLAQAQRRSAEIYADFSHVAAHNPAAWNPTPLSPEEILTITPSNRMICHPYLLLMNALLNVNQAAAVVLTDTETARTLGIPAERWVYVWGGAGSKDSDDIMQRISYSRSPAMEATLDTTLAVSGVLAHEIDLIDFYSCFPCVPKMAARHLHLAEDRHLTVTGGLTSFGGPGNNYTLHSIVAMAQALRGGEGTTGLVYGQGEYITKHHAIVLATTPRSGKYPLSDPLPREIEEATPSPIEESPEGAATIETYTVEYNRAGQPERGYIIGRLADGARFVANTPERDVDTFTLLTEGSVEPIGLKGRASPGAEGRNIFRFD